MWTRSSSRCSALGLPTSACAFDARLVSRRRLGFVDRAELAHLVTAGVLTAQRVECLLETFEVAEVAIDRREADVCDLVEHAQLVEHALADVTRCDLADALLADFTLDLERDR